MSLLHRQVKYGKASLKEKSLKSLTKRSKSKRSKKIIGLPRVIVTAVVLTFACLIGYTTVLYMLPFVSPKQILGITQHNYAAAAMQNTRTSWLKNTFLRPFELRRTFLSTHQGIRAHYVIPEGTVLDLKIEHCMRAIIVEAYKCKVVGSSTAEIEAGLGSRRFKFNRVGFYQFKDQLRYADSGKLVPITEQDGYRIIWARE